MFSLLSCGSQCTVGGTWWHGPPNPIHYLTSWLNLLYQVSMQPAANCCPCFTNVLAVQCGEEGLPGAAGHMWGRLGRRCWAQPRRGTFHFRQSSPRWRTSLTAGFFCPCHQLHSTVQVHLTITGTCCSRPVWLVLTLTPGIYTIMELHDGL